jgi:hypothetical protein
MPVLRLSQGVGSSRYGAQALAGWPPAARLADRDAGGPEIGAGRLASHAGRLFDATERPPQPSQGENRLLPVIPQLAIPAGNHTAPRRVNILGRRYLTGRFSAVHDWPRFWVSTEEGVGGNGC